MTLLSWLVSNLLLATPIAAAAWLVQYRLRQPALAHILWLLVLLKLVTPPLFAVPLYELPPKTPCELGTCQCGPHGSSTLSAALTNYFLGVWLLGGLLAGWTAWRRWNRFQRLISSAAPAPPEWQSLAERLAADLRLRRTPEVLMTPGRLPPLVVPGFRRPRLLLPSALLSELPQSQRSSLLLHELVHLRRGDHVVRLLESGVRIVYWWFPAVAWIGRQLRACEEACCDAAVVALLPDERRHYARLLLDVMDFVAPATRTVGHATAMNSAGCLERRLRSILADRPPTSNRSQAPALAVVGLACVALPLELRCDWIGLLSPTPAVVAQPIDEPKTKPSGAWMSGREVKVPLRELCCPS
jgi:bla regulator protein blaR1